VKALIKPLEISFGEILTTKVFMMLTTKVFIWLDGTKFPDQSTKADWVLEQQEK
jgi:hypothetical protein